MALLLALSWLWLSLHPTNVLLLLLTLQDRNAAASQSILIILESLFMSPNPVILYFNLLTGEAFMHESVSDFVESTASLRRSCLPILIAFSPPQISPAMLVFSKSSAFLPSILYLTSTSQNPSQSNSLIVNFL